MGRACSGKSLLRTSPQPPPTATCLASERASQQERRGESCKKIATSSERAESAVEWTPWASWRETPAAVCLERRRKTKEEGAIWNLPSLKSEKVGSFGAFTASMPNAEVE